MNISQYHSYAVDELPLDTLPVLRGDIHKRFIPAPEGSERDEFGRTGYFQGRGVILYLDEKNKKVFKVFGPDFCENGEGRFLRESIEAGLYDGLLAAFDGFILDEDDNVRGYVTHLGETLTKDAFREVVAKDSPIREQIKKNTEQSGYYLNDLTAFNMIKWRGQLSIIDLESSLPLSWFGKDPDYALEHSEEVDIGYPPQNKWHSPWWYFDYLKSVTNQDSLTKWPFFRRATRAKAQRSVQKIFGLLSKAGA